MLLIKCLARMGVPQQGGEGFLLVAGRPLALDFEAASGLIEVRPGERTLELFGRNGIQELAHLRQRVGFEQRLELRGTPHARTEVPVAQAIEGNAPALVAADPLDCHVKCGIEEERHGSRDSGRQTFEELPGNRLPNRTELADVLPGRRRTQLREERRGLHVRTGRSEHLKIGSLVLQSK